MANVQRILQNLDPLRMYPVKGSVEAIEVGDLLFWDSQFQGGAAQNTVRPASAGSAGASAADGRFQFAENFTGISAERHDLNSFDKNMPIGINAIVRLTIANSAGAATAANADVDPGTKVAVAVDGSFVPIDQMCVVDGLHSVTVADNETIGRLARQIKDGDTEAWVHLVSNHVMSHAGV